MSDGVKSSEEQVWALLKAARDASEYAYAPYSNFSVGAAVELDDGRILSSANMENASYGLTVCAEVGALQAASASGALGRVRRIAVVGGERSGQAIGRPTAPCGRCRQLIAEAASVGGRKIEVVCSNLALDPVLVTDSEALLPFSFGSQDLSPGAGGGGLPEGR